MSSNNNGPNVLRCPCGCAKFEITWSVEYPHKFERRDEPQMTVTVMCTKCGNTDIKLIDGERGWNL